MTNPQEDRLVFSARFPGLIDIVESEGKPHFLVLVDGLPECVAEWQGKRPPPKDGLPFLLPRLWLVAEAYHNDTDDALFADLVDYFSAVSELPSDAHPLLLAAFTAHTYLMELWSYSPILLLFAVPERGKSRTGKAIAYASYHGLPSETLREANLFRWSSDLGATLFLDVKDIWRKAGKLGTEDILLQRFEQGARVGRVLYPDRGPFRDTRYFEVFGATVIATNEPADHILDTRSITVNMPDSERDFPVPVTPERGLLLRERLVAFRARHMKTELPSPPRLARARLGDIVHPLATVVQLMAPQRLEAFRALVETIQAARLSDKSTTLEARLIRAMLGLGGRVQGGKLGVQVITDVINVTQPEGYHRGTRSVGWKLKGLGLTGARLPDGLHAVEYDEEKLARLAERYGVHVPVGTTSATLETSVPSVKPPGSHV